MTRLLTLWVVSVLWVSPLAAQTLRVQSGEHPTFTRLVARIPDGLDWRVEQDGTVARLFVEGDEIRFDTSDVFSRIPRDRLFDLVQAEPGSPLTLELACRCLVSSFSEAGGFAVLDIGDPVEGVDLPTLPKTESAALQAETTAPLVLPMLPTMPTGNSSLSANPSLPMAELVEDGTDVDPTELNAIDASEQAAALTHSERALQEQIARAALQGLVNIEPEDLENMETHAAEPAPVLGGPAPVNIRAMTAVDRDMNLASTPMKLTGGAGYCLDPDRLDISNWGNEEPFGAQVGAYRTRMAGEFDDLNKDDLIGLAKTYLYFAFGAEARQLLREVDRDNSELEILVALSHLIDEGDPGKNNPFENQMHCDSIAALWSVYAESVSPKDSVNSGAITRAFVELPPHIRDHIGPGLLRRFTNSGDSETAGLLLRIINRTSIQNDTPMQLAEAELIRLNGEEEVADQMVEDVAHGGSDDSPEALVALVQRHFETRKTLPNHSVELLASYALELRRSDIGEDLARSHALALALSGDFQSAFDAVSDLEKESANEIFINGLVLLTEAADDLTFLELSLVATHANPDGLPVELTMDIARRYIDIGFPDQATTLLERPMRGAAPEAFALLRAEASLDAGLPRRALLELVGRSGQKADALRAEALRQSGLHAEAAELYAANNELPEAARSEWLAGLPPAAISEADSAYSDRQRATQRMAEAPAASGEMTLAGARALLEQAETLRDDIDKLNEPIVTAE